MALVAPVEHGKIVETESQNSLANKSGSTSGMDKEAFLQLLVAQMRYQDPLEPTSNTEYISQYAQFSQVEQIQNMAATVELQRAASLVGQEVYIKTTTSSGDTRYIQGRVDYVVYENGKAYLSIDEELYSLDDLDTVVDKTYMDAYNKAYDFTIKLNKLPILAGVDLTDAKDIDELREIYEGMNDYERGFLAKDTVDRYKQYVERLKNVRKAAGLDEDGNELPKEGNESVAGSGDVENEENVAGSGTVSGSEETDGSGDADDSEEESDSTEGVE